MDCSSPGSFVHGILQARILETISGLPFLSPGDLPNPRIEPESLMSPAVQAGFSPLSIPSVSFGSLLHCHILRRVLPPELNSKEPTLCPAPPVLNLHVTLSSSPPSCLIALSWDSFLSDPAWIPGPRRVSPSINLSLYWYPHPQPSLSWS